MSKLRLQLEQAIAALEQQRALLGDDVVIRAIQPLQDKLATLQGGPDEQQLKQVTVLFADMKGSLELLADRDPEDARRMLDPVLG